MIMEACFHLRVKQKVTLLYFLINILFYFIILFYLILKWKQLQYVNQFLCHGFVYY